MTAPQRVRTVNDLRQIVAAWRHAGARIALVPTMGALHQGHMDLGRLARGHADKVIYSIFVNPRQFAPHEDLARYPRDEDGDAAKLADLGVDLIYLPSVEEIYRPGAATSVVVDGVSAGMEGAVRPHFFTGVATVVTKLLIQAAPDIAVFGEKDYQQLQVVKRLVADLDLPLSILAAPITREADGLAMSSRNAYLNPAHRAIAGHLNKILADVARELEIGGDPRGALERGLAALVRAGFEAVDYLDLRDAQSLALIDKIKAPARLLVAARIGGVRLLDNWPIG